MRDVRRDPRPRGHASATTADASSAADRPGRCGVGPACAETATGASYRRSSPTSSTTSAWWPSTIPRTSGAGSGRPARDGRRHRAARRHAREVHRRRRVRRLRLAARPRRRRGPGRAGGTRDPRVARATSATARSRWRSGSGSRPARWSRAVRGGRRAGRPGADRVGHHDRGADPVARPTRARSSSTRRPSARRGAASRSSDRGSVVCAGHRVSPHHVPWASCDRGCAGPVRGPADRSSARRPERARLREDAAGGRGGRVGGTVLVSRRCRDRQDPARRRPRGRGARLGASRGPGPRTCPTARRAVSLRSGRSPRPSPTSRRGFRGRTRGAPLLAGPRSGRGSAVGGAIAAVARDAAFSGWEAEDAGYARGSWGVTATLSEVADRYVEPVAATTGPRVIVIDDVHWIDHSSDGMVEVLVGRPHVLPVRVLTAMRPGPSPAVGDDRPRRSASVSAGSSACPRRGASRPTSRAPQSKPTTRAGSTSGPGAIRCSSPRRCGRCLRTAGPRSATGVSR